MTVQLDRLPSGVRVVSETMPNAHTAAFAISVDVGARHETSAQHGMSHLLEHMAFKGTSKLNARELAEAFDMMGGNVNAYTSHEHTVYYAKVLKPYAAEALKLLCDILTDSVYDETELAREREVVLQEMAMHEDTPDDLVFDYFQETAYANQPLGRSILGTKESVSRFGRSDVLGYTAAHYQPHRIVVAAAGAVQHDLVCAAANVAWGKGADTPASAMELASYTGGVRVEHKPLEQIQCVLGMPVGGAVSADYYIVQLLAMVLGGGMSSRLFQEIREVRGLAYTVSSFVSAYQDTGMLHIYAGTTREHVAELMGALREVLAGMPHNISHTELLRSKNQMKAGIVMARENTGSVAEWMARHVHLHGRVKPAEEILAAIDAIDGAAISAAASRYLRCDVPTITALGPLEDLSPDLFHLRAA
jgi:predicted Zn-dependent peptidase